MLMDEMNSAKSTYGLSLSEGHSKDVSNKLM